MYDFIKTATSVCWHADMYLLISFKCGMIIQAAELYILIPVWMTLIFIQGYNLVTNQNFCTHVLKILN